MESFPDNRSGQPNAKYKISELGMSAFSVFWTQSPSFLEHQRRMESGVGVNNARMIFVIEELPSDNQIRDILDDVSPSHVSGVFDEILTSLEKKGVLEEFRSLYETYVVALDGLQYHSSQKVHCENCNTKKHKDGKVTYSHTMVAASIVKAGNDKVICLAPEFITPQDGHEKQDCELAAGKRLIAAKAPLFRELGVTITGDDLYCHQPFCEQLIAEGLKFVLICKPESHKITYELIEELDAQGGVEHLERRRKRKRGNKFVIDHYRFVNNVALRAGADALEVNWCEIITTDQNGKVLYRNAFATNYELTADNVSEVASAGRARWKIENEHNNTLKTKGYHLEHNFGHGQEHLSSLLAVLNLLAFLGHTVLEIVDNLFQELRQRIGRRDTFFGDIRALTTYWCFGSWRDLLLCMKEGLEKSRPPPPPGTVISYARV